MLRLRPILGCTHCLAPISFSCVQHWAAQTNQLELATALVLQGANLEALDDTWCTALHLSAGEGLLGMVQLLVQHNASVDPSDSSGWTPLCCALAKVGGKPALKKLI